MATLRVPDLSQRTVLVSSYNEVAVLDSPIFAGTLVFSDATVTQCETRHCRTVPWCTTHMNSLVGTDVVCHGAVVDAVPPCTGPNGDGCRGKHCVFVSHHRLSVAINGIVVLVCPPTQFAKAKIGDIVCAGKGGLKTFEHGFPPVEFEFHTDSAAVPAGTVKVGILLIKDELRNCITIDLCP